MDTSSTQDKPMTYEKPRVKLRGKSRRRRRGPEEISSDELGMRHGAYVGLMLSRARTRAQSRGLEFSISEADISIPAMCPILGIRLRASTGLATDNSPSIDRIDSSKGYVPGNIVVISLRANRIKNDSTLQEIVKLAAWAIGQLKL